MARFQPGTRLRYSAGVIYRVMTDGSPKEIGSTG